MAALGMRLVVTDEPLTFYNKSSGHIQPPGLLAMLGSFGSFLWQLVTFQFDISMTISISLLLLTVYRTIQGFLGYLLAAGPVSTVIAAFTTVIVGPIPTVVRALALPLLQAGPPYA